MFYLGSYSSASYGWALPPGTTSAIPLRSPEYDEDGGVILFKSDADLRDLRYRPLGELGDQMRETDKRWLRDRMGYRHGWNSDHWQDVIAEAMTDKSDPQGIDTTPAKRPNNQGRNLLFCGDLISDRRIDLHRSPERHGINQRIRHMYRQQREHRHDETSHLRWLTRLQERIQGYSYRFFQGRLPDEKPLPHSTSVTETWPADEDPPGGDFTLNLQNYSDWGMFSASAYKVLSAELVKKAASSVGIRCDGQNFSSSDLEAWTVVATGVFAGISVACDNSSYAAYLGYIGSNTAYIRSATGTTTVTDVTTAAWTTPSNPVALKLRYDDNEVLTLFGDAGSSEPTTSRVVSGTQTGLDANTHCGAHIFSNAAAIGAVHMSDYTPSGGSSTLLKMMQYLG